jgi:Na+(H+)/acetate symporter ActP
VTTRSSSSLWWRPSTRPGKWAVRLAGLFVVLFIINSAVFMPASQYPSNTWWMSTYLPFYGIFMILCGLAAGVIALMAVIRKHERSWLVWLTLLPWAFLLFLLLGEFLVPH